jgi:hypothetical protein
MTMQKRILLAAALAAVAVVCPAQATLTSTSSSVTYTGNGATTAFTVPFKFLASSHLVVTVAGVTKTLGSHYTVSGTGNPTGTVTFTTAPANAAAVVITRTVPYTQLTSLRTPRTYDPETLENALDLRTMADQQLQNLITSPPASVLPANVVAKLNNIRFADQFATIQAAITDAGTTGAVIIPSSYVGSDTFSNPNTIPILDLRGGAGWTGFLNVKAFGATGNGSTDDTAPILAAANTCPASVPCVVYFPASPTPYLTAGIRLTDANKQVIFAGAGHFASHLRITSANADGNGISFTSVDNSWGGLRDITVETTAALTHVVYVKGSNNAFMFERALINGSDTLGGTKRAVNAVYLEGGSQFWGNFVYTTGITGFNFYLKDQTTSSMVTLQGGNADIGTSGLMKVESTGNGGTVTLLGGRYEGSAAKDLIQYATTTEGSLRIHGAFFSNGTANSLVKLASGARPHWFLDTRHQLTPTNIYVDAGTPANNIAAVTADFHNPILDLGGRLFSGQTGKYRLWVDSNNDVLRIKSGAPSSETDGYVVGSQGLRTALTYSASIAPTTGAGNTWFWITPTDGVAFALTSTDSSPNTAIDITVTVKNTFGVLGAWTFGAQYKIAGAWVQPANGFNRSITFRYDISTGKWVELYRTAADVAN